MTSQISSNPVYYDFTDLAKLRLSAGRKEEAAIEKTAKQFEGVFIKMMLKSMRDAVQDSGLFDEEKKNFYNDMYDQQLSLNLSDRGIGLHDLLVRQLGGTPKVASTKDHAIAELNNIARVTPQPLATPPLLRSPLVEHSNSPQEEAKIFPLQNSLGFIPERSSLPVKATKFTGESPENFVQALMPHAQQAAARLGLDPAVLVAQAALETGWGKHLMPSADGKPSFNFFGIKADPSWDGDRVSVNTLEFDRGVAQQSRANFRSYSSIGEAFDDYVNFLQQNPRYEEALRKTGNPDAYTHALQEAGYATDPRYARKISDIYHGDRIQQALQLSSLE